jgi:alanyl-tRNA synthetase
MAMAGGNDPSKLGVALEGVKDWVASKWVIKILSLMQK